MRKLFSDDILDFIESRFFLDLLDGDSRLRNLAAERRRKVGLTRTGSQGSRAFFLFLYFLKRLGQLDFFFDYYLGLLLRLLLGIIRRRRFLIRTSAESALSHAKGVKSL